MDDNPNDQFGDDPM